MCSSPFSEDPPSAACSSPLVLYPISSSHRHPHTLFQKSHTMRFFAAASAVAALCTPALAFINPGKVDLDYNPAVTSPAAGDVWTAGQKYNVSWVRRRRKSPLGDPAKANTDPFLAEHGLPFWHQPVRGFTDGEPGPRLQRERIGELGCALRSSSQAGRAQTLIRLCHLQTTLSPRTFLSTPPDHTKSLFHQISSTRRPSKRRAERAFFAHG